MNLEKAFAAPAITVQPVGDPFYDSRGVRLSILRSDLIHPALSGNKWFKLKYNLLRARDEGHHTLLSFGGPWSNHLHALAAAGQEFGFRTIGVVRGELPATLNPCLQDAVDAGMMLHAMPRGEYRRKHEAGIIGQLHDKFGDFYLIPEGGANREGAMGCAELTTCFDPAGFDLVCMACGTGTMLAGMASRSDLPLLGFQVLKGQGYLARHVESLFRQFTLSPVCDWSMNDQFHCGGYGKTSPELLNFMAGFERRHKIPLDPVYTGKLLYGLTFLIKRDFFPRYSSILAVHSGGLQGCRGIK